VTVHGTATPGPPALPGDATLADGIVRWWQARIDDRIVRLGTRLPSIRRFAAARRVSRHTVVEAYERLVALGYVQARRGSGFYVRPRPAGPSPGERAGGAAAGRDARPPATGVDTAWLLRNLFRDLPPENMPGGGLLPPEWLDSALVSRHARGVTLVAGRAWLGYGTPQGYLPLRQQLSVKLAADEIPAEPEQIITTAGVTQALDLVARHLLRPGDAVLVDDPGWFVMFASFAALGARVIGVPRRAAGPDLDALPGVLAEHRPKLFVLSSIVHNPTGTSMTAPVAHALLRMAREHDVTLVEDDIYGDLSPAGAPVRLAALDQLRRVIYVGGFSKTLAANLRVGYLAVPVGLAQPLTDQKLVSGLTSPEFGERVIARALAGRQYARHCARLRGRLDGARASTLARLRALGARVFAEDAQGMFLWADLGVDTGALATRMFDAGFLTAPGSLFSPGQLPSTWMRFNAASSQSPALWTALARVMKIGGRDRRSPR
jgi:DNA-binding transcriptional MocR family regulator